MLEILEIEDLRRTFIALQPALIRFVVARGASYEDAHDVVQDLYLKLERVPVDTLIEARAYLYRMADNLMLDRHRASQRRVRRDDAWTETNFDVRADYDEQPSADRVNAGQIPGQRGGVKAGHSWRGGVVYKKAPDRGPFCKAASAMGVRLG